MNRISTWTVALLLALAAAPAAAQGRGTYSLLGADTVNPGNDVVSFRAGWPDFTFDYTHGVSGNFDVGARLQFVYGLENTTRSKFGMAFAVPLRWSLSRSGGASLLFHVDPGLRLYTYDPVVFGFQFPLGLNVEFRTAQPLRLGIGADFNASIFVTGAGSPYFFFGPLIGPYLEYHVDQRLSFGVDTRFGAIVDAYDGGTDTDFGFRTQFLLAYRL